ncbi:deoxynucleoside kinase [Taibaiella soli]|uniref:Deoxynucleoside kinase n=2 Tax=Taibaiella soli TaxID=1649169 RepID=A0A2W2BT69_9BACT|nr:deoxynucleoside kinase [Taibaiella soli]
MDYRYIAVEGNIGAGKTTLAKMLAEHYNARIVLEEFADNTFLPKFYQEPERYAFPLELSFLADRYKQLKEMITTPDLFQEKIIADYIFIKSKLFARINLKDEEYELFQNLFNIIDPNLAAPDLLIYLHAPISSLQRNIHNRGRDYEQQIPDEYLEKVQNVYQTYLKQDISKTLIIDISKVDFLRNPDQFAQLTTFLDKNYDFKSHYLAIE